MTAQQHKGETCVLAYSGGLDTSVAVAWLRETHGFEVVTCTGDLGSVRDLELVDLVRLDRDRKSTRLNSSHLTQSRMPSSA